MFRTMITVLSALMGLYLFFLFRRSCSVLLPSLPRRAVHIVCGVLAVLGAAAAAFGGLSMVVVIYLVGFGLLWQMINGAVRLIRRKKSARVWDQIHRSGVLTLIPTVALVLIGCLNFYNIIATRYTVYTHKDIRAEGYRLALISDVHFSDMISSERLQQACDDIAKADVDAVILCGDIVDTDTTAQQLQTVFAMLGGIPSHFGTYYIYGNHDLPTRLMQTDFTAGQLQQAVAAAGITLLCDQTVRLGGEITLIGRNDRFIGERASLDALLGDVPPEDVTVVLDHRPTEYAENDAAGTDLVLSGHTHGGQLFPLNLLMQVIPFNDGVYGHYTLPGGTQTIVSSGLAGWGFPAKNAAPCEYVLIDILPQ